LNTALRAGAAAPRPHANKPSSFFGVHHPVTRERHHSANCTHSGFVNYTEPSVYHVVTRQFSCWPKRRVYLRANPLFTAILPSVRSFREPRNHWFCELYGTVGAPRGHTPVLLLAKTVCISHSPTHVFTAILPAVCSFHKPRPLRFCDLDKTGGAPSVHTQGSLLTRMTCIISVQTAAFTHRNTTVLSESSYCGHSGFMDTAAPRVGRCQHPRFNTPIITRLQQILEPVAYRCKTCVFWLAPSFFFV
jgi:hypothetical protein